MTEKSELQLTIIRLEARINAADRTIKDAGDVIQDMLRRSIILILSTDERQKIETLGIQLQVAKPYLQPSYNIEDEIRKIEDIMKIRKESKPL